MALTALLITSSLLSLSDSLPKPFSVLPLPLVYYTPETRLAYGLAATTTFRFRRDYARLLAEPATNRTGDNRPSQVTLGVAFTQNKQFLLYVPFQVFYDRNTYYVNGEAGYYRYNYYFYGVGQREVPAELYGVNFPRIRLNAYRLVLPDWKGGRLYAGVRYQYEDYQITSLEPGRELASGNVPGGSGSRLSGAGLGFFYDSRDGVFFPHQGLIADLSYSHQARWLGGNVQFDRYVADVSSYHSLSRRLVLAANYVLSLTQGIAPFNAQSLLGGTKRMRGYYEGRFRDGNIALLQAEARFDLYKRLGGVVFGALGILGNQQQWLRPNDPKAAYGAGLRFTLNRRDHLNIRVDYGFGRQSGGLYVTIGEAF